jgi:peptidoglycan/xylan/chitin deacetylase (PgdA/CDA1 family)
MPLTQKSLFSPLRRVASLVGSPAVVLLYHRVLDLSLDPQELAVRPDYFNEHMAILKADYHPLTAEEFADYLKRRRKFPKRAVLVTFDDGYVDNYTNALPVLESQQLQALFFITTSFLDTGRELWWDDLERILLGTKMKPHALALHIESEKYRYDTSQEKTLWEIYYQLQERLRLSHPDTIASVVKQLQIWAALPEEGRPQNRLMRFEELARMAASPYVEIGAHTHRHPALGVLDYEQQKQEVRQSLDILQSRLQDKIRYFSYPYGARKILGSKRYYNQDSLRVVKELGFELAFANYFGQVHRWTNPYAVPRMLVRNWSPDEFQQRMRKFFRT